MARRTTNKWEPGFVKIEISLVKYVVVVVVVVKMKHDPYYLLASREKE